MFTEIKSYRIFLDSGSQTNRSFTTINLYDVKNEVIGVLQFFDNEIWSEIPTHSTPIYLQYAMSKFSYVVDILRNEKPIYIGYWENQYGKYGRICTGEEPVGEGEIHTPLFPGRTL
jgi:hypothetical protein